MFVLLFFRFLLSITVHHCISNVSVEWKHTETTFRSLDSIGYRMIQIFSIIILYCFFCSDLAGRTLWGGQAGEASPPGSSTRSTHPCRLKFWDLTNLTFFFLNVFSMCFLVLFMFSPNSLFNEVPQEKPKKMLLYTEKATSTHLFETLSTPFPVICAKLYIFLQT